MRRGVCRGVVSTLMVFAFAAAGQPAVVDRHLLASEALRQQLEYERAMEELTKARAANPSDEQRVTLTLYEGILLAELGKREESKAAFTAALFERPDASLPSNVSPVVKSDFEAMKAAVNARLAKGVRMQGHRLSVVASVLPQLLFRTVEVQGEYRIGERFGAAANLGLTFGEFSSFSTSVQGRIYPLGSFDHGMPVGLQVTLLNVAGLGLGFSVGPFLGYKLVLANGFTLEARAGLMWAPGSPVPQIQQAGVLPIFNLNLGWSFWGTRVQE